MTMGVIYALVGCALGIIGAHVSVAFLVAILIAFFHTLAALQRVDAWLLTEAALGIVIFQIAYFAALWISSRQ